MLNWVNDDDGWSAAGYRIRLVRPNHWELLDRVGAEAAVITEELPLATTRKLSEAKREAERLEKQNRVGEMRRRQWGWLILCLSGFLLLPSLSPPNDLVAGIVLLVLTARTIGFLAGSYMARSHVSVQDFFYQ